MKWIAYKYQIINEDSDNNDNYKENFLKVKLPYSESNIELVKTEAYNGEYTIEDDGKPEPVVKSSQLDVIEAQITYTAMMTGTLLEV